ncbi:hypothetical protein [Rosenbergiella australiborealis]|uniref:Lipoprotein n=1 Tax=Rosenbergiella australiborealis TaxID=1544696 RepID=A0ABS5T5T0_9GAMM|nr:hypothetical protein [Rosenbergiella australiborealis]MBT0727699.1 hypothetical protein [Rosenbergiella australiborealis]
MKRIIALLIVLTSWSLLTGCAKQQPGGFSQIGHDPIAHSYQFRYQPTQLDHAALNAYLQKRCSQEGFDKVEALPEEAGVLSGYKTRWFQCNYKIKN